MKKYDVIIVGSGIGGLICACNIVKLSNLKVLLIEKNYIAGGLTSGFYRGGFYFESGTTGISIPSYFIDLLNKINPNFGDMITFETYKLHINDKTLEFDDFKSIISEFKKIHPEKTKELDSFFKELKRGYKFMTKVLSHFDFMKWFRYGKLYQFFEMLRFIPYILPRLFYYNKIDKTSSDNLLISIFGNLYESPAYFFASMSPYRSLNFLTYISMWNDYFNHIGYVKKGFLSLANELVDFFKDNGGEIIYNSEVNEFIIENKLVTGVKTKNETFVAKYFVSNVDLKKLVFNMIGKEHFTKKFTKRLDDALMSESIYEFYIGLNMDSDELKKYIPLQHIIYVSNSFSMEKDLLHYFEECPYIVIPLYYMVDENKNENQTSLIIQIPVPPIIKTNYQKISEENYKYIKKEITDIAIKRMNEIVPNFKEKISVIELATPRTFEKWVGTTEGASTGFTWNKSKSFLKATSFDKMFLETDLKNLYQCGAFSSATGGVFFSGLSGMLVAEQITKLHKKKKK